jgi:predicted amidohydrolase YtcJ
MAARLTTYVVVAIVSATLIAGLIVGAQRDDSSGPVDLIIHNAHVYTADAHGTIAQAIAVRGNTILRVGSDREVMRYRRPQTEVIDANGGAVLPGFNDAHASLIASGLAQQEVNFAGAATLDDVAERLTGWAETHPESAWITGRGWIPSSFTDATKSQLDGIVADRPVVIMSQDRAAAWVNSAALRAAGITRRTRTEASDIERDRRGEPTGVLRGSALDLLRRSMPRPSRDDRAEALSTALDDAPRHGITSVHDFVEQPSDIDLYKALRADTHAREDVRVYIGVPVAAGPGAAANLTDIAREFPDDPLIKTGVAYVRAGEPAAELAKTVVAIDRQDWQVAVETPDETSVHDALHAFEAAARTNTNRSADRRHRLEGAQDVNADDLHAFKSGKWLAVLFPSELAGAADDHQTGADQPSLDVLHWPARSLQSAGAHLAFGTDAPDGLVNPLASIAAIVERHMAPDQELALKAAINAWTAGAAWASFDERRKGTLEHGMLADFVVVSGDIFKMPPESIASATVDVTVIDGRVVYRRKTS